MRPRVYVVANGTLCVMRRGKHWNVGPETVIGHELLTLEEDAPLPIAHFTVRANAPSCTLEFIHWNDVSAHLLANPRVWIKRMMTTTLMLHRRSDGTGARVSPREPGARLTAMQRALYKSDQSNQLYLYTVRLVKEFVERHVLRHPDLARAAGILESLFTHEHDPDAAAEIVLAFLKANVIPPLLAHRDDVGVAEALYYLGHLIPGCVPTESGIRPAVDVDGDRITARDGEPADKAG